jgi:protein involved in polysaccharide export with SLBB domain
VVIKYSLVQKHPTVEHKAYMQIKNLRTLFYCVAVCLMVCLVPSYSQAQSLTGADLTTINVDDLSDEQLINYVKQAEASGYSQSQLEAFARQRGMPESQISKLRNRIAQLRLSAGQSTSSGGDTMNERTIDMMSESDIFGRLAGATPVVELTATQKKIFGFDLFRSDKLNFSPNLNIATPVGYVLGPGDGVVIDLWGATQQYWTLEVSPEGTIRPQDLSPVYVSGLTIEKAREKIIDRLSQVYGGLKPMDGSAPTIFSQISLGNIRTINVTIVGEVNSPGNYALNSLSTVYTALHAAGGPTEDGTFRSIRLIRDNKLKTEIDLYDFLIEGVKPNDQLLKDGDVVVVKLAQGHVEVEGVVRRPGIYELKADESFATVLDNAGGFESGAFKSFIIVDRFSDNGKEVLNISSDDFEKEYPQDGDVITIRENQELYSNRVILEGAVQMEGPFELEAGLTVRSLLERSGGLKGDAYLKRATIYRMKEDYSQETIAFDLQQVLSGGQSDIPLMNEDVVRVSSVYDLKEEYYIQINGEVALPGTYPYISNMQVEDVILLAGGLNEGASGAQIEISRRNTDGVPNSLAEIITLNINKDLSVSGNVSAQIKPFDQIYIRKTPNYNLQKQVTLEGEVTRPGIYSISRKDERISDLIERAEGLTSYAYPEGAILIRKTEFTERKSDNQVNREKLNLLKTKILSDTSLALNQARKELVERLERMITEIEEEDVDQERYVGNQLKKILSEDLASEDSLRAPVTFNGKEPTVIDLNEVLSNPGSKYDYILREGDVISIPGKLETVRVAGEVISPLNLSFDDSFSFKDYINDAGGFTSDAKKGRSYIQYPNGRKKQARRFLFFKFYPKVEPGSTIVVSKKPPKDKISLQEILAITSSLATITFLVDRITN